MWMWVLVGMRVYVGAWARMLSVDVDVSRDTCW